MDLPETGTESGAWASRRRSSSAFAHTCCAEVGDVMLQARCSTRAAALAVRRALGEPTPDRSSPPEVETSDTFPTKQAVGFSWIPSAQTGQFFVTNELMPLPTWPPSEECGGLKLWRTTDSSIVAFEGSDLALLADGKGAFLSGWDDTISYEDGRLWPLFTHLVLVAVSCLVADPHRCVLHAAAVADKDGSHALLLVGPTGSGKSTSAFAALELGWEILADDCVVVRRDASKLQVRGIARHPMVPPEVAGALGEPVLSDRRARRKLLASTLVRDWRPVAGVVIIGHSNSEEGKLQASSAIAVTKSLMRARLNSYHAPTSHVNMSLLAEIARLPAALFEHSSAPDRRLAVARTALSRFLSHSSVTHRP